MKSMLKMLLGAAVIALPLVGGSTGAWAAGERFVMIYHSPDSDSWWNTVKNGVNVAADQMDVTVDIRNPPTGDLADMARIVQQASA